MICKSSAFWSEEGLGCALLIWVALSFPFWVSVSFLGFLGVCPTLQPQLNFFFVIIPQRSGQGGRQGRGVFASFEFENSLKVTETGTSGY